MDGKMQMEMFGVQLARAVVLTVARNGMCRLQAADIETSGLKNQINLNEENMLIIPEPSRYYCEPDEDYFFAWLKAIPAIKNVIGTPTGLELTIEEPIDKLSFYELVGLMTRYSLDRRCLRQLCSLQSDPWFNDPKNYWYSAVFSD